MFKNIDVFDDYMDPGNDNYVTIKPKSLQLTNDMQK